MCFNPMAAQHMLDSSLGKHVTVPDICQGLTGTRGVDIPQHHMRGVTATGFSTGL